MISSLATFDNLDQRYRLILCDVWGCLHNGVESFPAAVQRLKHWSDEGRLVILLTNAPRPAAQVADQLTALGIPGSCYNAVITSGDMGLKAAVDEFPNQNFHFVGSAQDRKIITAAGYSLDGDTASKVTICSGFHEGHEGDVDFHEAELKEMLANNTLFLCLNPDQIVMRGDKPELCAGALGVRYETLGGNVRYFGKPHKLVYEYSVIKAAEIVGAPILKSEILAIGDGIQTDLLGAYNYGLDFAFIAGGIEAAKIAVIGVDAFLDEIVATNQMSGYRPHIIAPHLT